MRISFLVNSEYWEDDSSRYRLALTNQMLIPSLRYENLDDVSFWLRQSPMDPRWTLRREAFAFLGRSVGHRGEHPAWKKMRKHSPLIEVQTPDDVALVPGFLQSLRVLSGRLRANTTIHFRSGLVWDEGVYHEAFGAGVRVRILVGENHWDSEVKEFRKVAWCVARHQMNDQWVDEISVGARATCCFESIHDNTLGRYCRMQIKTGTAAGATSFWHRGRSLILSAHYKGRRSP